jgi:two-component system NtrC family sensor kinase
LARLLIISDDHNLYQVLIENVKRWGHQCDLVQSGEDIQERWGRKNYHLVLCSTHLKLTTGFLLSKYLLETHPDLAIIMLVNQEYSNLAEKIEDVGAFDFIQMPIDPDRMQVCLNNALYRQKIENQNKHLKAELKNSTENSVSKIKPYQEKIDHLMQKIGSIQDQITQAEKMASIGQLAAGVAHEINNPVGFVASNLNTLQHYQKSLLAIVTQYRKLLDEVTVEKKTSTTKIPLAKRAARIKRLQDRFDLDYLSRDALILIKESTAGILQVKKIIQDLKIFVHPGQEHPEMIDIHKHLDATLNLVRNQLKYGLKVQKEYGNLPQIKGWASQLNQVFLNIIVNAIQASGEKGTLTIKTEFCDHKWVEIHISDTGAGILKENLTKIFDSFYTTKPAGKGTGLGLYMSDKIIKRHKGALTVKSKVGYGSTFTIKLPIES